MKPKVLLFDFVETVADITKVPHAELAAYAKKARAIADGLQEFSEFDFGPVWDRAFIPHDTAHALQTLRDSCEIIVLTNSPASWVIAVSEKGNVAWDGILDSQMFKQCKPNPNVYLGAARLIGVRPHEAMMVAAHEFDTTAAKKLGFQSFLLGTDGSWQDLIERFD